MSQCLRILNTAVDICFVGQKPGGNVEDAQNWFGGKAALCLPGVFFTEVPAIGDQH